MADVISDLAGKCGISPEMARQGLGAVLSRFKKNLPAESFAKLSSAVPGSSEMLAEAESAPEASGGVLVRDWRHGQQALGRRAGRIAGRSSRNSVSRPNRSAPSCPRCWSSSKVRCPTTC